jgi:hypothetical protein
MGGMMGSESVAGMTHKQSWKAGKFLPSNFLSFKK